MSALRLALMRRADWEPGRGQDQVGRVFRRVAPTAQVAALRAVLDLRGAGGDDVVPNTSSFSSLCFCLLWVTVVFGVAGRATHLRVGNPERQLGATGPLLACCLLHAAFVCCNPVGRMPLGSGTFRAQR